MPLLHGCFYDSAVARAHSSEQEPPSFKEEYRSFSGKGFVEAYVWKGEVEVGLKMVVDLASTVLPKHSYTGGVFCLGQKWPSSVLCECVQKKKKNTVH